MPPSQTPSLTWQTRLARFASEAVRKRGAAYFRNGYVELEELAPDEVMAIVRGTMRYRVVLADKRTRGGRLSARCSCPAAEGGYTCKHAWATALAADAALAAGRQAEVQAAEQAASAWRSLLFPDARAAAEAAEGRKASPPKFRLIYELALSHGRVRLSAIRQNIRKDGQPGRQVAAAQHAILHDKALPDADRPILNILLSAYQRELHKRGYMWSYYHPPKFEDCELDAVLLRELLPLLAATQRCTVTRSGDIVANPLRQGEPSEAALEFKLRPESLKPKSDSLVYTPHLRLGERLLALKDVDLFLDTAPLAFVLSGALHTLPGTDSAWVQEMQRSKHQIRVPKAEAREFIQVLEAAVSPPAVEVPAELAPRTLRDLRPRPCLEVELGTNGLGCRLWLDYDGAEILREDARRAILDPEAWTRLERDEEAEAAYAERLSGLDFETGGAAWQALETLAAEGWLIRTRDRRQVQPGQVSALRVSSGVDWFELEGAVAYGDAIVPLAKAVRAYLRGERTIALPGGGVGLLPEHWLSEHARALDLGDSGRKDAALRFHSAHALLLDALLGEQDAASLDRNFLDLRRRMREWTGITPPLPPASFHGELRPYQRECLGWLDFLATFGFGGILADDMGLGKTIQVLAWLTLEKERGTAGPCLVVAPTSLLLNWRDEATRFAPGLRVAVYAGKERGELADAFRDQDLVLTTYGLLRRDVEALRRTTWRWLILDESQAIKNPDAQTAKAARILNAERRLCLTGTPIENRLDDLWSQLHFLNRGMLGSRQAFTERFAAPVGQGDAQARDMLQKLIKPVVLRRTKEAVAADLPEKQDSVVHCDMTKAQAALYAKLREHYRSELLARVDDVGLGQAKIKVLEGLLRLRQAACHGGLVGEEASGSGKLEELVRLLKEVLDEGHKALVFSQFTRFLGLVRARLEAEGIEYAYLDGRAQAETRRKRVAAFQAPDGPPVFCISLKAGGAGLNLTAADYVFLLDPWWNPAVEAQAVDRAHRIGQERKVFAYRLVSSGTIDEKVLELQRRKRELSGLLQEGATSAIGALTREDLETLLS